MYAIGSEQYRLLICDNYAHVVTSARVSLNGSCRVSGHSRLLQKGLQIPDGINVSQDRRWIVISNHVTGHLLVYRNDRRLHLDSDPVAVLRGMDCPHGVRFADRDQKRIVVDSA